MAYFIDCCQRNKVPLLIVFQHLYQLKAHNRGRSSSLYYFAPHEDIESIISNKHSNLHLNRSKYIQLKCKLVDGFDFPIEWSSSSKDVCLT